MNLNIPMLAELQHEAENTRKMLKLVPNDKLDWAPHAKSMPLGRLASHISDLPGWIAFVMSASELDLAGGLPLFNAANNEELLANFDKSITKATAAMQHASNEEFMELWTLRKGDHIILTLPKGACIRSMTYNHMVHHRGQLSVYLRLLDIPVPGMYGPSKDDQLAMEAMMAAGNN